MLQGAQPGFLDHINADGDFAFDDQIEVVVVCYLVALHVVIELFLLPVVLLVRLVISVLQQFSALVHDELSFVVTQHFSLSLSPILHPVNHELQFDILLGVEVVHNFKLPQQNLNVSLLLATVHLRNDLLVDLIL